jgi:methyl-accepting chemotaxis protein
VKIDSNFAKLNADMDHLDQLSKEKKLPKLQERISDLKSGVDNYESTVHEFRNISDQYDINRELATASVDELVSLMAEYEEAAKNSIAGESMEVMRQAVLANAHEFWKGIATSDIGVLNQVKDGFSQINGQLQNAYDAYPAEQDPQGYVRLETAMSYLQNSVMGVETMIQADRLRMDIETKVDDAYDRILENSVMLTEAAYTGVSTQSELTASTINRSIWFLVIGVVIASVLAILFGTAVGRNINARLENIIERLRGGSEQVDQSSTQLSEASQGLAESASHQAASVQETTSSLEEISSQTKQAAANAGEAETAMNEVLPILKDGVKAMHRMNEAMEEIKNASQETSKIIKTIDDIAFQTNLLALNAAVEAARAGEAGKGFAVVAEEVRSLAQRSATAAQDTSQLIQRSQNSSEKGSEVAHEVSENLETIQQSIESVSALVVEISAAAREQSTGIEQMNSVMVDMDNVVQNNASASEESASSAEELSSQAYELMQIVNEMQALVGGTRKMMNTNDTSANLKGKFDQTPNTSTKYTLNLDDLYSNDPDLVFEDDETANF